MSLYFRGSAENSIASGVMISWFIFVNGKQPQNAQNLNPSKFTAHACRRYKAHSNKKLYEKNLNTYYNLGNFQG